MNLTRRSFLRSLGAALLAPLLPKVKRGEESVRYTTESPGHSCWPGQPSATWASLMDQVLHNYWFGPDWDWDGMAIMTARNFDTGEVYYSRDNGATWVDRLDDDDVLTDFDHGEEVDWAARLEEIMADFRERMRNADWEAPAYSVVLHPDNFDWSYANVPWFRRAVDGFDV